MRLVSSKYFFHALIGIAVLSRATFEIYYTDYLTDKSCHVAGAVNLLNGHGLQPGSTDLTDLARVNYEPLVGWPPGYSLLLAPLIALSGNVLVAISIVDVGFVVLFLFTISGLFRVLAFSRYSLYGLLAFYTITFSLFYYGHL